MKRQSCQDKENLVRLVSQSPESRGKIRTVEESRLQRPTTRDGLREALVASQPIDEAALEALAPARAETIRAYLVGRGLDSGRVSVAPEATTVEPDTKETAATKSEKWVRCQLELKS